MTKTRQQKIYFANVSYEQNIQDPSLHVSEADEAAWWDRNPDFFADCFDRAAKQGEILRGVPRPVH